MRKNGFTLVELLVTMTVIAILMGLAFVSFSGTKKTARDGKRKADLEQIRSALEMYRSDNEKYPSSLSDLTSGGYLSSLPADPLGYTYYYEKSDDNHYQLCAYLETGGSDDCGDHCSAPGACNYKVTNP